jgi:hypothetical protein
MESCDGSAARDYARNYRLFFWMFSRFEYALKQVGFVIWKAEGDEVKIDWGKFTKEPNTSKAFEALKKVPEADYIIANPPKKRIKIGTSLDWRVVAAAKNATDLCGSLRRLRNNLFHGDKGHPSSVRDRDLLQSGLVALDAMIQALKPVKEAFEHDLDMA